MEVHRIMESECPFKDWKGDKDLLNIHLKEVHHYNMDAEKPLSDKPIGYRNKPTFPQWTMKLMQDHPILPGILIGFVLGVLYVMWAT